MMFSIGVNDYQSTSHIISFTPMKFSTLYLFEQRKNDSGSSAAQWLRPKGTVPSIRKKGLEAIVPIDKRASDPVPMQEWVFGWEGPVCIKC